MHACISKFNNTTSELQVIVNLPDFLMSVQSKGLCLSIEFLHFHDKLSVVGTQPVADELPSLLAFLAELL